MSLRDQLRGTGVALVTPFKQDSTVDYEALQRLISFVIDGGVDYLVTLGTTGETPTLTKEEKTDIINFTFAASAERVPVVVGIGGNDTTSIIADLENFPVEKATAILSASPYYNKPSQEGLYQHYKAIAEVTTKPIILYNVPGRTGSNIAAATTLRLAKDFENICGIKEASGNMIQCMQILKDKPADFFVTSGDDNLALAQIACGMDGIISVAANGFPKYVSKLVQHVLKGELSSARALHYDLLPGFDLMFAENNPSGIKAFLSEMGIIENYLRLPLVPISSGILKEIQQYLPTLK
jgi:4-hydroxy-tetrahydrodipicolinate synthase